ncbi:hypothetical protein Taro_002525 [Colocasia esculenta]|uniref:Uncharacterized protein n=1 Tax=Colocasia esculenta TaxID=4460 RepID=A0A843TL46_COLES|nr:hypothetical protein [Colocasia esculenta]
MRHPATSHHWQATMGGGEGAASTMSHVGGHASASGMSREGPPPGAGWSCVELKPGMAKPWPAMPARYELSMVGAEWMSCHLHFANGTGLYVTVMCCGAHSITPAFCRAEAAAPSSPLPTRPSSSFSAAMKGPGLFSDIGKKGRDLLEKDYSYDQKLTFSTRSASGLCDGMGWGLWRSVCVLVLLGFLY